MEYTKIQKQIDLINVISIIGSLLYDDILINWNYFKYEFVVKVVVYIGLFVDGNKDIKSSLNLQIYSSISPY